MNIQKSFLTQNSMNVVIIATLSQKVISGQFCFKVFVKLLLQAISLFGKFKVELLFTE